MNISWIKKFLTAVIFLPAVCSAQSYSELYPKECEAARTFYAANIKEFEQAGKNAGLSPAFLFAIVAPELSQYAYLSNKFETYSLKVMYAQGGKAYANFSIGYFQMKPSFIEAMENSLIACEELIPLYADCLFSEPDSRQARVERINRLNSLKWQMKYLSLFCCLVNKHFDTLDFADDEEKLRFYASAYNTGFHKTAQQIKVTEQKPLFPHFSRQKFRYSDIAVWFFTVV